MADLTFEDIFLKLQIVLNTPAYKLFIDLSNTPM